MLLGEAEEDSAGVWEEWVRIACSTCLQPQQLNKGQPRPVHLLVAEIAPASSIGMAWGGRCPRHRSLRLKGFGA
jgi:hypothetical protein